MRVLAVFLVLAGAASAQEQVDLKIKVTKGQTVKVEASAEMTGTGGSPAGQTGDKRPFVRNAWACKESWSDLFDTDSDGVTGTVKRTFSSAKVGAPGRAGEPAGHEAALVQLVSDGKTPGTAVSVTKGKVPQPVEDALKRHPLEAITDILPANAVKPSEEWTLTAEKIAQFHRALSTGMVGSSHTTDLGGLLAEIAQTAANGNSCDVKGKVTATDKTSATIEFSGMQDTGVGKVEIKGTLKWDTMKSRPTDFTWSMVHEVRANDDTKTKGWREEWKFARSWK